MKYCEACGQVLPDPMRQHRITNAELDALSAWWWTRSVGAAARVMGLREQTVKNQLLRARQRNDCHKTLELAQIFAGQLRPLVELTQQNSQRRAA